MRSSWLVWLAVLAPATARAEARGLAAALAGGYTGSKLATGAFVTTGALASGKHTLELALDEHGGLVLASDLAAGTVHGEQSMNGMALLFWKLKAGVASGFDRLVGELPGPIVTHLRKTSPTLRIALRPTGSDDPAKDVTIGVAKMVYVPEK